MDSKMKGGMVLMTLNRGAVHRWLMGQAERHAIIKQCEVMANVTEVTRYFNFVSLKLASLLRV